MNISFNAEQFGIMVNWRKKQKEKEDGKYGGLKNHTALLGKRRVCHYTDKRKIWKNNGAARLSIAV